MIIDCHTHLNNYHNEAVASLEACLDDLQLSMRRNRIDMAAVLTSYKVTPGRPSTQAVVKAIERLPNIFVVAGVSFLHYQQQDLDELSDFLRAGSVRGLKIYPGYEPFYPNDPHMAPVFDLAEKFDVPLMIHSGDTYTPKGKIKYSHPIHVDDLAVDRPNLKIIICHIGNPWIRDCMEVVYKNQNVYTDISGLTLGDFDDRFEQFLQRQFQDMLSYGVEPDSVLFGTDWPIASMESYIEFMEEIKMPPADRNKIMYENAVRLFKLSPVNSPYQSGSLMNWLKQ
jgi:predicted TIM-barrel fold metal-dependent hydrolase